MIRDQPRSRTASPQNTSADARPMIVSGHLARPAGPAAQMVISWWPPGRAHARRRWHPQLWPGWSRPASAHGRTRAGLSS